MKHINEIDITKRCNIKPENTIWDFLKEITSEQFRLKMINIISWKNDNNINISQIGLDAEKTYTPYLNSNIEDIPEEILNDYSQHFYTNGEKYYLYSPCCR